MLLIAWKFRSDENGAKTTFFTTYRKKTDKFGRAGAHLRRAPVFWPYNCHMNWFTSQIKSEKTFNVKWVLKIESQHSVANFILYNMLESEVITAYNWYGLFRIIKFTTQHFWDKEWCTVSLPSIFVTLHHDKNYNLHMQIMSCRFNINILSIILNRLLFTKNLTGRMLPHRRCHHNDTNCGKWNGGRFFNHMVVFISTKMFWSKMFG